MAYNVSLLLLADGWAVFCVFKIGDLYSKDPIGLELCAEFWCPVEPVSQFPTISMVAGGLAALASVQPPQRQVTPLMIFIVVS